MKVGYFFSAHDFYPMRILAVETNNKEILRMAIRVCMENVGKKLPEQSWRGKNLIHPFFVSFDIPGTKNEAFLHIDGMGEEVTFRVDVVRKGTQKTFSKYLKSCPHSDIAFCVLKNFNCNEIYNSVVYLSKKANEYWDERK